MTSHPTPTAAWDAFAAAIAARDADAARSAATAEAWRRQGDSALLVYETASKDGFRLAASGPAWIEGDRAVLPVKIEAPGRSTSLFGLLEQRDGSWLVSAGIRDDRHASLFLAGALPAVFEVTDLKPSPEAEQWARARSEELRAAAAAAAAPPSAPTAAPAPAAAAPAAAAPVKILGVHALPQRNRAVVGLQHTGSSGRPAQDWVCLDTGDGGPKEIGRSSYPSLGLLLTGVQATMPARQEPVSGAGATDKGPDTEEWKIINTFLQALVEVARTAPPPADTADKPDRVPQALGEAIARTLESAGQPREAAVLRQKVAAQPARTSTGDADAPPTALALAPPDQLEPVRQELQREIDAYRQEKGLEPNVAILDEAFLAAHGQELGGRLMRVLANALPALRPLVQDAPAGGPDAPSGSAPTSTS